MFKPLRSRSRSRMLPPPGILSRASSDLLHDTRVPPTPSVCKMAIVETTEHILCARPAQPATHKQPRNVLRARARTRKCQRLRGPTTKYPAPDAMAKYVAHLKRLRRHPQALKIRHGIHTLKFDPTRLQDGFGDASASSRLSPDWFKIRNQRSSPFTIAEPRTNWRISP